MVIVTVTVGVGAGWIRNWKLGKLKERKITHFSVICFVLYCFVWFGGFIFDRGSGSHFP